MLSNISWSLVLVASVGGTSAQQQRTNQVVAAKAERPKSVFQEPLKPPFTDPFFPESKRLPYNAEPVAATTQSPTASIDQIILKGVSGTDGKRFALINRRTFAAGESGTVQTSRGPVNIEVLEVKERSVVIKVENDPEPKEVYLRPEP